MKSAVLLLAALPVFAHVVSISTGDAQINGDELRYELRIPLYEVTDPSKGLDLLARIEFRSGETRPKRTSQECHIIEAENALFCSATYKFSTPPDLLTVRSELPKATVPNHVHILRATRGERSEQVVLDLSFPEAELRFRPLTAAEVVIRQCGGAAWRTLSSPWQWLFLLGIALAATSWGEAGILLAAFAVGESVAAVFFGAKSLQLAPRFLEMAAALTIAYLAVEILFLPRSRARWAIVAVLGAFHGLGLAQFQIATDYAAHTVLAGAIVTAGLIGALLVWITRRIGQPRWLSWGLLVVGMCWFAWRLVA
ncbi:MAG: HupE/UreJ family protein [Acidobacteriota bacterium]